MAVLFLRLKGRCVYFLYKWRWHSLTTERRAQFLSNFKNFRKVFNFLYPFPIRVYPDHPIRFFYSQVSVSCTVEELIIIRAWIVLKLEINQIASSIYLIISSVFSTSFSFPFQTKIFLYIILMPYYYSLDSWEIFLPEVQLNMKAFLKI